jgi:hypothetical protein
VAAEDSCLDPKKKEEKKENQRHAQMISSLALESQPRR